MTVRISNGASIGLRLFTAKLVDTDKVNRRLSVQLYGLAIRNFNTMGTAGGGKPWQPLKPATIAAKRKKGYSAKPLIKTGALRQSFMPFHDRRVAGVGSEMEIAAYHEEGTSVLPARPMLPTLEKAREYGIRIYDDFVLDSARKAGLK